MPMVMIGTTTWLVVVFIGCASTLTVSGDLYCEQERTSTNATGCTSGCVACEDCITWPVIGVQECTYSTPFCYDKNYVPVLRCCVSTKDNQVQWEPAYDCHSYQVDIPNCPEGFEYNDQIKICYGKYEGPYPPSCPYEETVAFEAYRTILDTDLADEGPFWMPVRRTSALGFMTWQEASPQYMALFQDAIVFPSDKIAGRDCLVYHNSSTFASATCDEVHQGICAYPKLVTVKNNLCKFGIDGDYCRQSDFSTRSKCFCVTYEPVKDGLVEFLRPYQNSIYPSLTTDPCMIGLFKTNSSSDAPQYLWSSGAPLAYGYWSREASFGPNEAFGAMYGDGWRMNPEPNWTKCYLYEKEMLDHRPQLNLAFDGAKFVLTIDDADGLKHVDDTKPLVFCFTDASPYELVYRYPSLLLEDDGSYSFIPHAKGPGRYWCEAFAYPDLDVIKTDVLFYRNPESGSEFVTVLRFTYVAGTDALSQAAFEFFERVLFIKITTDDLVSRIMEILALDEATNQVTLKVHLSAKTKRDDVDAEFDDVERLVAAAVDQVKALVVMDSFLSADYCMAQTVDGITWQTTPVGSIADSDKFCFSNGQLVRRSCRGNFMDGAEWDDLPSCDVPETSEVTDSLLGVLESNDSVSEMIQKTRALSERFNEYVPLDVFLLSGILEKSSGDSKVNLMDLVDIVDNLHRISDDVLDQAQFGMKATDRILHFVDEILLKSSIISCERSHDGTVATTPSNPCIERSLPHHLEIHSENFLLVIANITNSNITGLLVKGSEIRYLYIDDEELDPDLLDLAVVFDRNLRSEIIANGGKFITAIYTKDALFNENSVTKCDVSKIASVLFPGLTKLSAPLTIVFNNISATNNTCSYWSYAKNASGTWALETPSTKNNFLESCDFYHTTHFALLLTGTTPTSQLDAIILEIITNVSCGLSLFGLAAILLTAFLFRRWRRNTGNQILINFSMAIFIEIAAFYASNAIKSYVSSDVLCTIIGIVLHYSLISQFCWMFIIAVLQFRRFVEVLGGPPKYVLLKACLCGWILPLLPVLCVYFLDQKNYVSAGHVGLCYPSGLGLYLGVWLPIAIIVTINFVIFLYIIYNVVHRKTECTDMANNDLLFQWRLGILLFFMLGLTWSFGLLTELNFGIVFVYLFCITAPGQGFVMFLFFIVFNRSTRSLYVHSVKSYFTDSLSN